MKRGGASRNLIIFCPNFFLGCPRKKKRRDEMTHEGVGRRRRGGAERKKPVERKGPGVISHATN